MCVRASVQNLIRKLVNCSTVLCLCVRKGAMGVVRCPKICIYFDSGAAEVEALLISACAGKSCKFQHSKRDKNFTASVCVCVCT